MLIVLINAYEMWNEAAAHRAVVLRVELETKPYITILEACEEDPCLMVSEIESVLQALKNQGAKIQKAIQEGGSFWTLFETGKEVVVKGISDVLRSYASAETPEDYEPEDILSESNGLRQAIRQGAAIRWVRARSEEVIAQCKAGKFAMTHKMCWNISEEVETLTCLLVLREQLPSSRCPIAPQGKVYDLLYDSYFSMQDPVETCMAIIGRKRPLIVKHIEDYKKERLAGTKYTETCPPLFPRTI